jgi:hypothetical protein
MSTPRTFQDARLQIHQLKMPRPPTNRAKIGLTVGDKVVQPSPISIPGHPTWPESARASVDGSRFSVNMRNPNAMAFAIQSVPIKYLSASQYMGGTIPTSEVPPFNPIQKYGMQVATDNAIGVQASHHESLVRRYGNANFRRLTESAPHLAHGNVPIIVKGNMMEATYGHYTVKEDDLGIAATTPILGQYVPTFGWPDDWGWYWEYLDARLFVPEASFAVKMKTRMVWKDIKTSNIGSCIDADEGRKKKIVKAIKRTRILPRLIYGTHNAMTWGNSYQEIVGNSRAVWGAGSSEMDYALSASGIIYGLPRPLLQYTPTTYFGGLKSLDPRAVRIEIHPQEFDLANGEVYRSKYIQRRWAGPLAPTVAYPQSQQVELDFHPDQIFCMQFNRLPDGIYGYSIYRETLYALKGYLLMLQFLPTIVQKRADPLLHFKFGGDVQLPTGLTVTEVPSDDDIEMEKERFIARQPGEDIYTKVTAEIEEVYKGGRNSQDLIDFIHEYRDRCFLGMGIPLSIGVNEAGQEVKWGSMKYEISEDEIRLEYQMPIEEEFNRKLMPLLGGSDEDRFLFPEISEEDQRADAIWLGDLWSKDLITRDFAVDRLKLTKKALQGKFFSDVQNENQQLMMKQQSQLADKTGGKAGPDNAKAGSMPPAPNGKEKYRLRDTSDGYIVERMEN